MRDGLEMIYEQMLKPEVLEKGHKENIRREILKILLEIKTIQRTDNMERELALKVDKITGYLNQLISAPKKQPTQIYKNGIKVK